MKQEVLNELNIEVMHLNSKYYLNFEDQQHQEQLEKLERMELKLNHDQLILDVVEIDGNMNYNEAFQLICDM